jgi:hypothetical protein
MARLLGRHVFEQLRRTRILLAQPLRDANVYPAVVLLVADGEGEHFLLGQIDKAFHDAGRPTGSSRANMLICKRTETSYIHHINIICL